MLNENRVKLMTRMARYEKGIGKDDIKISSFYKKDYVSMHVLITLLLTTIGFGMIAGLVVLGNLDSVLQNLTMNKMIVLAGIAVIAYIVFLIGFGVFTSVLHKRKHANAKQRVKQYYRDFARLKKLYTKEK